MMKSTNSDYLIMRFKIFILSTLLLTLITGILFYKNLSQIGASRSPLDIDFDELRYIDQEVNTTAFYLRKNLNADTQELSSHGSRIKELLAIINDINKNSPELKFSVDKIKAHFDAKEKSISQYVLALEELRKNTQALLPAYNDLVKNNIKFMVDKKDFYLESLLDIYMYLSFSHKENELRLQEDQKIMGQILNFAAAPDPFVKKFATHIENIHLKIKETDQILMNFKETTINEEMSIVSKYYQESIKAQSQQNENLLTFMVVGILVYVVFMIFLLKKR